MALQPAMARIVVDDDESILETLSGILEDEGYEVISASSGESALNKFSEADPDIVLLDVWMADIDEGIKEEKRARRVRNCGRPYVHTCPLTGEKRECTHRCSYRTVCDHSHGYQPECCATALA